MSNWWGKPDTATEEGSGLSGFFTGDSGQDFGERLGMLGEIWSRIGSGTGLQGISGQMGAMNERSGKRREKSRRQQMANRLADKLEKNNPQLAAMIRSDPEFGLNLVGKQMEAQQESNIRMSEFKAMTPLEIKRAEAKAIAEGKVTLANTLAELRAKQDIANNSPLAKALMGEDGDTATSAAPDAGVIPRTDTAPGPTAGTATPPPIPNAGTGDMGGGGQPGAGSTAPISAAPTDPASAFVNDPMKDLQLSPDKNKAARQIDLTRKWRVPIQPMQYDMLLQAQYRNDGSFDTIMNNIQTQYDGIVKDRRDKAEAERIRLDNRGWDLTGKRNAEAAIYQSELPQVPETAAIGPTPRGGLQQGMQGRVNPESMAILTDAGFNDPVRQFGMDGIDSAAQQIKEQRINTGSNEGAISALRTGVATRETAQGVTAATNKKSAAVQKAAAALLQDIDTSTPEGRREAAIVQTLGESGDDPFKFAEAMSKLSTVSQQRLKDAADMEHDKDSLNLETLKYDDKVKEETRLLDQRQKEHYRTAKRGALALTRAFDIAHRSGLPATGGAAPILSLISGTNASDMKQVLSQVKAIFAFDNIQQMRESNPNGAGPGNVSDSDMNLAADKQAAISSAQTKGEFNYAVKDAINSYYDLIYGEGIGPPRLVLDREDTLTFAEAKDVIPQFPGEGPAVRRGADISTESLLAEQKRRMQYGGRR